MTRARDIANLVDSNGDIVAGALDNVPAADLVNDTTPQLGGSLDLNSNNITGNGIFQITGDSNKISASNNHLILHDTAETDTGTNWWYMYRNGGDGQLRFYADGANRMGLNRNGTWSKVPSGTMINQEVQTATNYLTTSSGSWQTVWQPVYTPKMAGSTINIALSVSTLPEGSNSHDYWLGVYSDSARTVFTNQQQYWLDGSRAAGITGWHMVNIYLQTSISNTVSQGNNLYFLIQQRQNGSGTAYWNYSNAQSKMTITEVAP